MSKDSYQLIREFSSLKQVQPPAKKGSQVQPNSSQYGYSFTSQILKTHTDPIKQVLEIQAQINNKNPPQEASKRGTNPTT